MATKKSAVAAKAATPKTVKSAKAAAPAEGGADPALTTTQPEAGEDATAAARGPSLRIRDLVTRVTEATGGKRKDVKEMVEATLKALGDAMAAGEDMNLPGFGRTRITRSAEKDGASHLTMKVKRGPHRTKHVDEPLAEDGEDS